MADFLGLGLPSGEDVSGVLPGWSTHHRHAEHRQGCLQLDPLNRDIHRSKEKEVFITRLRLAVNAGGYQLERTPRLTGLAYVMTIHKSHVSTQKKVGMYLNASVLARRQPYLGTSRYGDPDNFFVCGLLDSEGPLWTNSIVDYGGILAIYNSDDPVCRRSSFLFLPLSSKK